jgi:NDP-sugar pyrophosphorylase family protein
VLHARENRLTGFEEKPKFNYLVSMGVYILNRSVLDRVPAGQKYGFDDLMLDMLAHNESVHVEPHSGYWLDIGRVDDYMRAVDEFDDRRKQLLPDEKCPTKNER